jgi:hypothetical protein
MNFELFTVVGTLGLFLGMVALTEIGRRIALRKLADDHEGALAGTGALEGGIFALLGLLIGFTFAGAADRFDERRHLIVEETTAIETAFLRLDVLPAAARPELQDLFRHYLDSRLESYRRLPDVEAAEAELARSEKLQEKIWTEAIAKTHAEGEPTSSAIVLLPALNQMIDITTKRTMATHMHPPKVIYVMLFGLALIGALMAGYGMAGRKARSWLHILSFTASTTLAVFVIMNMEYPRLGVIRVSAFDKALMDLRSRMDSHAAPGVIGDVR